MPLPSGVRRLFRLAHRGGNIERDVRDELAFHLATRRAELEAKGMEAATAREQAEREFGDVNAARSELTDVDRRRVRRRRGAEWRESLTQDARYALRGLRRTPGFTVVVLLTMALGIGANTAVFSVVNALLLNPISYPGATRMAMLWRQTADGRIQLTPSAEMIDAWHAGSRQFDGIESFQSGERTLTGSGEPSDVHAASVSATFANFAGASVIRGRGILAEDTKPGASPVALLSEALWKGRYGSDESVIGKAITLDGTTHVVVGIVSAKWRLPSMSQTRTDVWLPLQHTDLKRGATTIARLKPGVTVAMAERELDRVNTAANIKNLLGGVQAHSNVVLLSRAVWFRSSLYILSAAVLMLLLVTCANIAHLLLARGAVREREIAVRRALGATRSRIVSQQLVESTLIAMGGCLLGVGVGFLVMRLLVTLRPVQLEALSLATLDPMVLAFAVVASLVTGLAFGLIGAFTAGRTGIIALRSGVGMSVGGPGRHGLRSTLVVTEMALSTVLLVVALLLVRTVVKLQQVNPGFDANGLYAVQFKLPDSQYGDSLRRDEYARRVLESVQGIPGVTHVTTAGSLPPQTSGIMFGEWEVEGDPNASVALPSQVNQVRPEYFASIGMRLTRGRAFDDGSEARKEVIINEGLAGRLFKHHEVIGAHIRSKARAGDKPGAWSTVIGVAPNTAWGSLMIEANDAGIYFPSKYGTEWGHLALAFRVNAASTTASTTGSTTVSPERALAAVQKAIRDIDPALVPPRIVPEREALLDTVASQRFVMLLLSTFAVLALVMSGIGLYGVISWSVAQRTREIGIRVALGGTPAHIARLILSSGLHMCVIGLVLGLIGAKWATRIVESQLYGVTRSDPWSYAAAGSLLLAVALGSCVAPLRRATGVTPLVAMRAE